MHVGETACIWCNDNDLDFKSRVTCISKHFFKFQPYVQSVIQSWASSFCSYEIWKVLELRFIKKQYYWHLYSSVLQRILLISFIISIYLFFLLSKKTTFFLYALFALCCYVLQEIWVPSPPPKGTNDPFKKILWGSTVQQG